jgi:epsilon-lactone hydrolase
LVKTYDPLKVGLYGTSAGATLSASTVVRLRQLGLPVPAALGFFSSSADMARNEDSGSFFGVKGLADVPVPTPPDPNDPANGGRPLDDPVLSPIYADLKGFPPTLCMAGTRDLVLSGTANFHRALRRAGVEAELIVFDGMPHAFWYNVGIPESKEAVAVMATFLAGHVRK